MGGTKSCDRQSPWRWAIAAIGLLFACLELPEMFGPLPDYAQHDSVELVMFYAVPALITAAGLGFAFFALRSGVLADAHGLVIRPAAGMRSKRVPVETVRAVTMTLSQGAVFASMSPAPRRGLLLVAAHVAALPGVPAGAFASITHDRSEEMGLGPRVALS